MSIIYLILINNVLGGRFEVGRFIDLFIWDTVISLLGIIAVCEVRRVKMLRKRFGND